jgi:amidase
MDQTYRPDGYHNTFGPHAPVMVLESGDILVTTTLDSRGRDGSMESRAMSPNPLTGPFYVEGAEPGDTLAVDILSIRPNRAYGYCGNALAAHVVDPSFVANLPERRLAEWHVDAEAWNARLTSPQTALGDLVLPLSPMLGCIGVAPKGKQAISSSTSAEHGGNMDYRGLCAGVTVQMPVFERGALLFIGDGHAIQGDGEIVGMGIEISMEVSLRVRVLKGLAVQWPRGYSEQYLFAMGNARPLDQALQHATTELLRWLVAEYNLDVEAASILLGQCIGYDIGNVFDPAYTVVARLDRSLLPAGQSPAS